MWKRHSFSQISAEKNGPIFIQKISKILMSLHFCYPSAFPPDVFSALSFGRVGGKIDQTKLSCQLYSERTEPVVHAIWFKPNSCWLRGFRDLYFVCLGKLESSLCMIKIQRSDRSQFSTGWHNNIKTLF